MAQSAHFASLNQSSLSWRHYHTRQASAHPDLHGDQDPPSELCEWPTLAADLAPCTAGLFFTAPACRCFRLCWGWLTFGGTECRSPSLYVSLPAQADPAATDHWRGFSIWLHLLTDLGPSLNCADSHLRRHLGQAPGRGRLTRNPGLGVDQVCCGGHAWALAAAHFYTWDWDLSVHHCPRPHCCWRRWHASGGLVTWLPEKEDLPPGACGPCITN